MTETMLQPGDFIHAVDDLTAFSFVWPRGSTIELTAERIASTVNRLGQSWLSDLSEEAQLRRWGRVRVGLGPWPEGVDPLTPGSTEHALARDAARREAYAQPTGRLRNVALREVTARFGSVVTSRTLSGPSDPELARAEFEVREAQRQADALKASEARSRRTLEDIPDLDTLMDLQAAASFGRTLERQDALADDAALRERP